MSTYGEQCEERLPKCRVDEIDWRNSNMSKGIITRLGMHVLPEPGPRDANQAEAQADVKLYQSFRFSLSLDHALAYTCFEIFGHRD